MARRLTKETGSQNLASAALSLRAVAQGQMRLALITLSSSLGITETVTVTIDAADGATYDSVLDSATLSSESDYVYDKENIILNDGDAIVLACTNANTTGVVYGKILLIET